MCQCETTDNNNNYYRDTISLRSKAAAPFATADARTFGKLKKKFDRKGTRLVREYRSGEYRARARARSLAIIAGDTRAAARFGGVVFYCALISHNMILRSNLPGEEGERERRSACG